MQIRVSRPARAERATTSCGECRRRKQKCDRGQPCNNCSRRFPQPLCEYKVKKRQDAGLQHYGPTFSVRMSQPGSGGGSGGGAQAGPSWASGSGSTSGPSSSGGEAGQMVPWSGVGMGTQYPAGDGPQLGELTAQQWETISHISHTNLPVCDAGCAEHSDAVHEAIKLLKATRASGAPWDTSMLEGLVPWKTRGDGGGAGGTTVDGPAGSGGALTPPTVMWQFGGPVNPVIGDLPIDASKLNIMLIQTFTYHLYRFKGSLDGYPDPDNPFVMYYVPWAIQSRLLAQVSLFIAAASLTVQKHVHIDHTALIALKGQAIHTLNHHLRSDGTVSDEAISAVTQLISNEWYFGETQDLQAHLRGLREMIRLRGGYDNLGMRGLVAKVALITDAIIAISLEITPFLQHGFMDNGPEFDLHEASPDVLKPSFNTPFLSGLLPFVGPCADALGLHPATASILDDVRFLIATVLSLPAEPTQLQLAKLRSTAQWMLDRISNMPEHFPARLDLPTPGMINLQPPSPQPGSSASPMSSATASAASAPSTMAGSSRSQSLSLQPPSLDAQQQQQRSLSVSSARSTPAQQLAHPSAFAPPSSSAPRRPSDAASTTTATLSASVASSRGSSRGSFGRGRSTSTSSSRQTTPPQAAPPAGGASSAGGAPSSAMAAAGAASGSSSAAAMQAAMARMMGGASSSSSSASAALASLPQPDFLYTSVRLAALIYLRAIASRRPLSAACSPADFLTLWATTWRVPLRRWKEVLGIFLWVACAIAPACVVTPYSTHVKSILMIGGVQVGLEDWGLCVGMLRAGVGLVGWLKGGEEGAAVAPGSTAGEKRQGKSPMAQETREKSTSSSSSSSSASRSSSSVGGPHQSQQRSTPPQRKPSALSTPAATLESSRRAAESSPPPAAPSPTSGSSGPHHRKTPPPPPVMVKRERLGSVAGSSRSSTAAAAKSPSPAGPASPRAGAGSGAKSKGATTPVSPKSPVAGSSAATGSKKRHGRTRSTATVEDVTMEEE